MRPDGSGRFLAAVERHFAPALPFARFARNLALASLAGLLPVLALYIALRPGFAGHLLAAEGALAPFLRQVITNGLPVVLAVNWAGFALFGRLRAGRVSPAVALGLDFAARVGLLVLLHAAIFVASARIFGSFGGDPVQALRVLGPTLVGAAGFGNLSGVYLYATLASGLPLHLALAEAALGRHRGGGGAAIALGLALFALQVATLAAIAVALAGFA